MSAARILIVDDMAPVRESLTMFLRRWGHDVTAVGSGAECIAAVQQRRYDLILLDLNMSPMDGFETLTRIRNDLTHTQIYILTANDDEPTRKRAFEHGANGFIGKDIGNKEETNHRIQQALLKASERLRDLFQAPVTDSRFVGSSPAMQRVHEIIRRAAPTDANILILGETGTGKELVARTLHEQSTRKAGPFVAVNCAAIAETLLESEMFGHVRGAFTGADRPQMGKYEAADGGTLFLDEIAKSSLAFQSKLLRLLETHRFTRLGAPAETAANVRLICAAGPRLHTSVTEGTFLIDLYYRINVIPIQLPRLCERKEEIPALVRHFVSEYCSRGGIDHALALPDELMERFLQHPWSGNIRELRNLVERGVILSDGKAFADPFELEPIHHLPVTDYTGLAYRDALAQFEADFFESLLERHGGNRHAAAEDAGIDPATLYRKLKKQSGK